VEVLIETANAELAKKGFAPDEARVYPDDDDAMEATLRGTLVRETHESTGEIVRLVLYLPRRDDLVELVGRTPPGHAG
jgi:hypothetical protein